MSDGETVEIERDALRELAGFADTHGDEYGGEETYRAIMAAYDALGGDPSPYMVWNSSWGERPDE